MTRMEPASPAAPWLDWIEGTAFLSYLDPAGRGPFFPCQRSFALVKPDVGEGDALAGEVSQPDQVLVVGDVVSVPTVHSASPSAKGLSQPCSRKHGAFCRCEKCLCEISKQQRELSK